MNKGFTLVELLAVLFMLSVITVLTVPNIVETSKKSRENEIKEFEKTMENAAEIYVETHQNSSEVINLKQNGTSFCISTETLKENGLVNENLKDPSTNMSLGGTSGAVIVTNSSNELSYKYERGGCE
ncbi:MAG: type II secretion system protein [Bacilli bacterium]|nr:type II secretion system protein [Bacilli bacterium]